MTKPFVIPPVGVRRLETLANFLDALPTKVFSIHDWMDINRQKEGTDVLLNKQGELKGTVTPEQMHNCGAAACAVGWACTIPEFRKAGLRMTTGEYPVFRHHTSFDAVVKFFKIALEGYYYDETTRVAIQLFDGSSYTSNRVTPKMVAKRIRKLLKDPAMFLEEIG